MGEQNRRAVELEPEARPDKPNRKWKSDLTGAAGERTQHATDEADERQTRRQAPDSASPAEGAEADSIG